MPLSTRPLGHSELPIRAFDELQNKRSQNVRVSWPWYLHTKSEVTRAKRRDDAYTHKVNYNRRTELFVFWLFPTRKMKDFNSSYHGSSCVLMSWNCIRCHQYFFQTLWCINSLWCIHSLWWINSLWHINSLWCIIFCDALILCDVLILWDASILCDALVFCDALILCDALISHFNSVKFSCITTAASFLSRFELITISLLALHVKDFISMCMNHFNNDHGLILNFFPQFFYPYYTYFYIFLYETIKLTQNDHFL